MALWIHDISPASMRNPEVTKRLAAEGSVAVAGTPKTTAR
jgi:hypothetical protein